MFYHTVIKWIKCLPCDYLIQVKKYRTTQGADTPKQKERQDQLMERWINNGGYWTCPKCRQQASIIDPQVDPIPPPEIDTQDARLKYEAMLKLQSVAEQSAGQYPDFKAFCDYLRKCYVSIDYKNREIHRILIAGGIGKLDYVFVQPIKEI